MPALSLLLLLIGTYPCWRAWRANRATSLTHALAWAGAAWLAWLVALAVPETAARYVALALTGSAGVGVLGARRPGVAAWNFVVLGLLAVLLLWLAEGRALGGDVQLGAVRLTFLAGTLLVGVLNYLPTRLGPAALALAAGCFLEVGLLAYPAAFGPSLRDRPVGALLILSAPWVALLSVRRRPADGAVADLVWLDFRDRFGVVWGLRVREQFNRAAANAGLQAELDWSGLRETADAETSAAALTLLRALLKRFGPPEPAVEDSPA
jgi:hypothetical protein